MKADTGSMKADNRGTKDLMDGLAKAFYRYRDAVSPRKLNETGRKMSEEFGAKAWAEAHADDFREQVADLHPYDVQGFCFDHVTEDILTEDELLKVKDVAYDNGTNMFDVLRVLAYELRDCLVGRQEQIWGV